MTLHWSGENRPLDCGHLRPRARPAILTLAGIVARGRGRGGLQRGEGGGPGAQGRNHLHDAGHEHVCGAHGAAALQHRPIGLLLDVHVGLHGHRLPAARGVDGDLLVIGAGWRQAGCSPAVLQPLPAPGPTGWLWVPATEEQGWGDGGCFSQPSRGCPLPTADAGRQEDTYF